MERAKALLAQAETLDIEERIELAEAIWDTIPRDAGLDVLPLPDSHREELDRRLADLEANPDDGCSWEELRQRLERRERRG